MLTDITQTITYTFDTKVLPPYDADTDWTKAEAYRFCDYKGKVNACIDWYRLFKDDVDFQRFVKGLKH